MTQEDKELLLKDLCARLPYGVKILHEGWNFEWDQELSLLERIVGIDDKFIYTKVIDTHTGEEYRDGKHSVDIFDDRPYLRPMSSMTEEEKKELLQISNFDSDVDDICYDSICCIERTSIDITDIANFISWLNAHHFDYRGLIEKDLAIAVTEENNPYKN
jgi:hypothetical protein